MGLLYVFYGFDSGFLMALIQLVVFDGFYSRFLVAFNLTGTFLGYENHPTTDFSVPPLVLQLSFSEGRGVDPYCTSPGYSSIKINDWP